jgi:hypothetical protein
MHDSQDGNAGAGNPTLLSAVDCLGCHANADENTSAGGATSAPFAPQVDWAVGGPAGFINNAGFFDNNSDDATHHNVDGLMNATAGVADFNITNAGNSTAPGGTFPTGPALGAPTLVCQDCHDGSGAHHGSGAGSYRLILGNTTTGQADFGALASGATVTNGTRGEVVYNASDMNLLCQNCHPQFHQDYDPAVVNGNPGNQRSATAGTWVRHPTDIKVENTATGLSIVPINAGTDNDTIVVGTNGVDTDIIMCLSCHLPHGGRYNDLLAFNYGGSGSYAGDGDATGGSQGCETCHSYAGAGM